MRSKIVSISHAFIHVCLTVLVLSVPLFFRFGRGEHYYFSIYDIYKEALIEIFASLIAGFYLLKVYLQEKNPVRHSPLIWPLLLFFVTILLSLLQAYNIHEGFIFVRRWLANIIIIFVAFNSVNKKSTIKWYLNCSVFVAAIVALYGIAQNFGYDFPQLHQNFNGNSTFGNPNFACEYILVIFPLALLLIFGEVHVGMFVFYIVTAILMLLFLLFDKSRAVWIGGAAGACMLSTFLIVAYQRRKLIFNVGQREKKHALLVLRSLCVCVVLAVITVMVAMTPVSEKCKPLRRIKELTNIVITEVWTLKDLKFTKGEVQYGDTTTQRILIWRNTLRMVKKVSILGVGIGNFKIQYQPHRTKAEQISTGPDIFVRRSHNEYVQFLAEIGLFGIVFFFWIIATIFRMSARLIRQSQDFYGQCLGCAFMLSLMSSFVSIFFNFSLQTPTPCMAICFVMALLMASYRLFLNDERESVPLTKCVAEGKRLFSHGMIVAVLAFFAFPFWLIRPAQAYYCYQYGQALERMGLKNDARIQLEKSLAYFYPSWETHFVLANMYALLGDLLSAKKHHLISLEMNPYHQKGHYNLGNTLYKIGETKAAIEHYKEAVRIDSVFYQGFNNLGSVYYKENDLENHLEKSLECFREVVALKADYPSGQYNIGYILYLLGRHEEALPYLQKAYKLNPTDPKVKKVLTALVQKLK